MEGAPIDPAASAFLRDHVNSFETLEVLVVLSRATGPLSSAIIAAAASLPEHVVVDALAPLVRCGAVARPTGAATFVLRPRGPDLDHAVRTLLEAYRTDRLAIIRQMSANAMDRVRLAAVRAFADAFVVGGKKDEDG